MGEAFRAHDPRLGRNIAIPARRRRRSSRDRSVLPAIGAVGCIRCCLSNPLYVHKASRHQQSFGNRGQTYFAVNHPNSEARAKQSLIFAACSSAGSLLALIALSTTLEIGSPSFTADRSRKASRSIRRWYTES